MKTKTIISTKHFLVISLLSVSCASIAEKIAGIQLPEASKFESPLIKEKETLKLIKKVRQHLEDNKINILKAESMRLYQFLFNENIRKADPEIWMGIIFFMTPALERIKFSLMIDKLNLVIKQAKKDLKMLAGDKKYKDLTSPQTLSFNKLLNTLTKTTEEVTVLREKRVEGEVDLMESIQSLKENITTDEWHELVLVNLAVKM